MCRPEEHKMPFRLQIFDFIGHLLLVSNQLTFCSVTGACDDESHMEHKIVC